MDNSQSTIAAMLAAASELGRWPPAATSVSVAGRGPDQVVDAEIAVHQRDAAVFRGYRTGQGVDQRLHRVEAFGLGGTVLFRPARHLTRKIIAGLAVIAKPGASDIELRDGGERIDGGVEVRGAQFGSDVGQCRIPEDATRARSSSDRTCCR